MHKVNKQSNKIETTNKQQKNNISHTTHKTHMQLFWSVPTSSDVVFFIIKRIEFIVCWLSRDSGMVTKTAPKGALTLLRLGKKQTRIVLNLNFSL